MNRTWKIAAAAVLICGGLWAGSVLNLKAEGASATGQPGTSDDPVVTKSYVDQQIQKALNGSTGGNTPAPTPTTPTQPTTPSTGGENSSTVEVVTLRPGQTLIAKAGAEFVVRGGKAVIYSNDSNGVADLTDGKDVTNGLPAITNHLLSFPREGRGIQVQSNSSMSLTVLVRGGYVIK
ncbi:hypothetical protein J2Z69_002848 [Paenibacillus shirakamiensis]|uniref:Uncharacterized protein n=1 Tax=Paenibacillus shirakamiensis TaxID=1265935 RepID=A0ABS4JJB9_9BACL|nr:hypothetical protein [Paenibacillus shirakamiensis]MBP2001792.1 hypothetical protein [Paenibacillus shirakamiensis]